MKALPCPPECTFDWEQFHKDLDTAISHMITDAKISTAGDEYLPSKTSILKLAEYSRQHVDMEKERKK